jgi:hypothetical protein
VKQANRLSVARCRGGWRPPRLTAKIPAMVAPEKSDQTPEPAEFPLDALNPTMRTIVEESAETYQIDPALPAMAVVAVVAGAIGKRLVVTGATSGRRTHLNVYVIPGAPKSYGKNAA